MFRLQSEYVYVTELEKTNKPEGISKSIIPSLEKTADFLLAFSPSFLFIYKHG